MADDDRIYDEKIDGAASTIESCMKMGGVILKPKDTLKFGFGSDAEAKNATSPAQEG